MSSSKTHLPARVIISYIFDYAIIIALAAVFFALDAVEPFHQNFALVNYTLQYPYAVHERVPVTVLYIVAVIAPAAIIAIYTLVIDGLFSHERDGRRWGKYPLKTRLWELNCGILGLLLSLGAAFVITGTFKNAVGKPRPDLIDRCQVRPGSVDPLPYGLSNYKICTQPNNAILKDGFRSFPSGHSSSSFAGLFYLSLYLAAKLHVLDSKGEVWKVFVCIIPTIGAGLVASSRIMDARHHPFDVISGSLLGVLCAWVAYRQYFPPLSKPWLKGRAHPMRSWGSESRESRGGPVFVSAKNMYSGFHNATDSVDNPAITVTHTRNESQAGLTSSAGSMARPISAEQGTLRPSGSMRRHRREDSYASYHSSDDGIVDAADEYELQPTAYSPKLPQSGGLYDPVNGNDFAGGDIGYHSQTQPPQEPQSNIDRQSSVA